MNMFGGGGGGFGGFGGGGFGGGGFGGGGGGFGSNRKKQKPPAKTHEIPVSLHDFYYGKQIKIQFDRQKFCSGCKGEGSASFSSCSPCGGRGIVEQHVMMGPGMMAVSRSPCGSCGGNGKIASGKCDKCNGKKVFNQEKILDVRIEPGMKAGDSLIFQNECSDDPNYVEVGDVQIYFQDADETMELERKGDDLYTKCSITFSESILGKKHLIMNHPKYPTGFNVDIPKGTLNQEVLVIEGEGMPKRNNKQFGNFQLKVEVLISQKEKQILSEHTEEFRKLLA
jgi:DnaJ family protein A protein 2